MSSLYVRNFAYEHLAKLKTPFYKTINETSEPDDDLWLTVNFDVFSTQETSYCRKTEEYGVINLFFMSRPGVGDLEAISAAESDSQIFYDQKDQGGLLVLTNRTAPEEGSDSNGSPLYVVSVGIEYRYFI